MPLAQFLSAFVFRSEEASSPSFNEVERTINQQTYCACSIRFLPTKQITINLLKVPMTNTTDKNSHALPYSVLDDIR